MTNIEKYIQWGIEGGWDNGGWENLKETIQGFKFHDGDFSPGCPGTTYSPEEILLDPKFWQAVGKTRGWSKYISAVGQPSMMWKSMWHRFIDHLADGKTIDEALGLLE